MVLICGPQISSPSVSTWVLLLVVSTLSTEAPNVCSHNSALALSSWTSWHKFCCSALLMRRFEFYTISHVTVTFILMNNFLDSRHSLVILPVDRHPKELSFMNRYYSIFELEKASRCLDSAHCLLCSSFAWFKAERDACPVFHEGCHVEVLLSNCSAVLMQLVCKVFVYSSLDFVMR